MAASCPCCSASLACRDLVRSAVGLGPSPRCLACRASWTVGHVWQGNFMAVFLLSLLCAVVFSVKMKSALPYGAAIGALATMAYLVCRHAKPRPVTPATGRFAWLHYGLLVFFVVLLLRFFAA